MDNNNRPKRTCVTYCLHIGEERHHLTALHGINGETCGLQFLSRSEHDRVAERNQWKSDVHRRDRQWLDACQISHHP